MEHNVRFDLEFAIEADKANIYYILLEKIYILSHFHKKLKLYYILKTY